MNILAIDTSSKYFSLAITRDDILVSRVYEPLGRELSRQIIPTIEKALKKSGLALKHIDYFACGLGPGSFTGLRVGLATIKGLAFSLNKPIVGVGSLDIIAHSPRNKAGLPTGLPTGEAGRICPLVDARRSLVYSALFCIENGQLKRKSRYLLIPIKELLAKFNPQAKVLFSGDGLLLYRDDIEKKLKASASFAEESFWYPLPENLLFLAREKIANKEFSDLHTIVPLYLYPKECQIANSKSSRESGIPPSQTKAGQIANRDKQ